MWGEENDKVRHVALLFNSGNAEVVGIFVEFKENMISQLNSYA